MPVYYVANETDLIEGGCFIANVGGLSIGIYRIDGELYALSNYCPHEGAPLCKGEIAGTTLPSDVYQYSFGRQGEIVRCPWHGWEFEIKTGESLVDAKMKTKTYPIEIRDGRVGIVLPDRSSAKGLSGEQQ